MFTTGFLLLLAGQILLTITSFLGFRSLSKLREPQIKVEPEMFNPHLDPFAEMKKRKASIFFSFLLGFVGMTLSLAGFIYLVVGLIQPGQS